MIRHERFELIQDFADKRRLKMSRTDDGEKIVAGRLGDSHIYQYSLTELGVAFVPGKWTGAARLAKARLARLAGQNVAQNAQNPHQNGPLGV
jgi:hypothetical protein